MHKSTLGRSITVLINLVSSALEQPKILYTALSSIWFNVALSDFVSGKTSTAYNNTGKHSDFISCTQTSSIPAFLALKYIALKER